jgi:hypothetical protein
VLSPGGNAHPRDLLGHLASGMVIAWLQGVSRKCSPMSLFQFNSVHGPVGHSVEAAGATSNWDKVAERLVLGGIAIFTLLFTIAWVTFLTWIVWVAVTASREANSPAGCFQSIGSSDLPRNTACT